MTAAGLATLLTGLPVVTEEMELPSAPQSTSASPPEDLAAAAGMAEKRRMEYLAGRQCARRALERLGVRGHVLRAGADRAPLWPPDIVGSITHTGDARDGYCGVAVARRAALRAIGIDAELNRPLPDELLATVLTERERDALRATPAPARGRIATIIFSAKESVYKTLSPLFGVFLEFHQVEIDLQLDGDAGVFAAHVHVEAPASSPLELGNGRALITRDLLFTAVAIEAADALR